MVCKKCGKELPDEAMFCLACGAKVEPEETAVAEPVVEEVAPVEPDLEPTEIVPVMEVPAVTEDVTGSRREDPKAPGEVLIMVLGIISMALCTQGLAGLILSIIAKKKARAREAVVGPLTGKAKVGKILASIALPISIVMLVLTTIYVIISIGIAIGVVGTQLLDLLRDGSGSFSFDFGDLGDFVIKTTP